MSVPALASVEDIEVRMGTSYSDTPRAQAALDDASALIRAEASLVSDEAWLDDDGNLTDVPAVIVAVCCKAARRSLVNPDGITAESLGDFQTSYQTQDVYLTEAEKRLVRMELGVSIGGLGVISFTRGPVETPSGPRVIGLTTDAP